VTRAPPPATDRFAEIVRSLSDAVAAISGGDGPIAWLIGQILNQIIECLRGLAGALPEPQASNPPAAPPPRAAAHHLPERPATAGQAADPGQAPGGVAATQKRSFLP
jgi:hypothetical protein